MVDHIDDFLTVKEYADKQNVSTRTVYRWLQKGLIFGVKVGAKTFIPEDEPSPNDFDREPESPVEEPEITDEPENFPIDEPDGFADEDDEGDCFPCPCDTPDDIDVRDEDDFPSEDVRRHKAAQTPDEARDYAAEIECEPKRIIRRTSDCLYVVIVECSK